MRLPGFSFSYAPGMQMSVLQREDPDYHAKLAPSSAERWIICPGSIQAQQEVKDEGVDDSNEASRLGTAAHALLEACLLIGSQPEDFVGAKIAGKGHPVVDQDMCDAVHVALDYIEEYIDTYGIENLIVLPESRVYIGPQIDITGDEEKDSDLCNGTSDTIIAHRDLSMCVVIDYKNGVGKKSAKENPQCMLYAAGVRQLLGKFKKYRSVIIQPRAGKKNPVEEWEFSDAVLRKFLTEKVRPSARAAILPNAPRVAGDHCRGTFCKAAATCRTYKTRAFAVARVEFTSIDDEPDPDVLTEEEFLEVLNYVPFVRKYLDEVEKRALRLVERNPKALSGWTLGWGKRQRVWDDEQAAWDFCEQNNIAVDEFAPRVMLSPAGMFKLVEKRVVLKGKRRKRGAEVPPNPLEAYIKYSIPAPKLVRKDAPDASEEFEEI